MKKAGEEGLMRMYHGTSSVNWPRIQKYGLHMPYLTVSFETARYFAQAEVENAVAHLGQIIDLAKKKGLRIVQ